jgi:2-dehydro-3-deoxy-D-gluconate 5-dehydrogenase
MGAGGMFNLSGKTALVTGVSRGIGRSMAIGLAKAGADIVGVSAHLAADGSEIARQVEALGRSFSAHACDFGDRDALLRFARDMQSGSTPIDILVNNAGTILRKPAEEHPDESWDKVIEINLTSAFILTREIGRGMLARGYCKVIFTASLLTFQGGINVPGYSASKGGIGQLTKAFANEWASRGVNVNAIAPGYIETDVTTALRSEQARSKAILDRIPAGRWGRPEDFEGAVVFLASDAAAYIHGEILTIDGGWMGR